MNNLDGCVFFYCRLFDREPSKLQADYAKGMLDPQGLAVAADLRGTSLASITRGVTVSAVKSRVSRGRAMLHERLLQCCKIDRAGDRADGFRPASGARCKPVCAQGNIEPSEPVSTIRKSHEVAAAERKKLPDC